jgi:hypothetical protein
VNGSVWAAADEAMGGAEILFLWQQLHNDNNCHTERTDNHKAVQAEE